MTKPLGYYTNYTLETDGVLLDIQQAYGANLEGLNKAEKLALITSIAGDLACQYSITDAPYRNQIFEFMAEIHQLPFSDREGLIECLINGVRYQNENT